MYKNSINKETTRKEKSKPALLFLLLTLFLLSSCPVKKGIQALLHGSNSVENSTPNYNKTLSTNKTAVIANPQICSTSTQSILDGVDLRSTQSAQPALPLILVLLYFLPALVFAFPDFYHRTLSSYFSKATFPQGNTLLYIRNRLLLI